MKRISWLCVALVAITLAFGLVRPTTVHAADHREAPFISEDPPADVADVFMFLNPHDPTKVVFAMTVNAFAVPGVRGSYSFSPGVLYQFKIDNDGDAEEDLVIQAMFDGFESARDPRCLSGSGGQFVVVRGPARPHKTGAENLELEKHAPEVSGCTNATLASPAGMRVFAGLRDDPFVTDAGQLNRILGGAEQVFRQVTSPVLGPLDGRTVDASGRSGNDTFGGFNASALVVEVPRDLVQGSANRTGTYLLNNTTIGFWGTTSRQKETRLSRKGNREDRGPFVQIQRVGQTLVKTVFIPPTQRDRYNHSVPEHDLADLNHFSAPPGAPGFSRFIPDALRSDDGTGNTIAARATLLDALGVTALPNGAPLLLPPGFENTDRNLIRRVIFPDVLRLDLGILPPGDLVVANNGLHNGRRLGDDVTDILLRLARQLADVNFPAGSGVPGSGPARALALNCTTLPNCPDRRVLAVLQGTDFIEEDAQVEDLSNSGNDRPLLDVFPFFAAPHPLPGNSGTVGYPPVADDGT